MEGKVVVVTGASKGIGLATSRAFAARGAHVVMLARSRERLDKEASNIGDRALPICADVGDPTQVRNAFEHVAAVHGRIDVLVNNAGVAELTSIEDATDDQIVGSIATNLLGPIYTTRAAIPLLKASGGGSVINISSESTMAPFPYLSLYASAKGGLETFARAALAELKPYGIRVTVVVCGATLTEFASDWDPEVMTRFFAAAQESGHLALTSAGQPMQPEAVADALLYIASRPAGQMIDVLHVRSHDTGDKQSLVDFAGGASEPTNGAASRRSPSPE
ncbi:MAG: short-chain dehydrogenase/reductase [Actinomycetia bacterium]|nr:short-chain dehydrogenase/reductase [Actinomycetes bacterium]